MTQPIQTGWGALATVVLSATLWNACSTEVDLTAPYDSIPVVYGLLELESDTQWVKINRTWLGEGNQLVAAQVADSSEYPAGSVTARVVELIPSGTGDIVGNELATGREWVLRDTVLENKSTEGVFFGPSQRVYFTSTLNDGLRDDMLYRLEATLPDGSDLQAVTSMVESSVGSINRPPPNLSSYKMGFASVNPDGTATYPDFPFQWSTSPGASRYDGSLAVHFEERHYADDALTLLDSIRERTLYLALGTRKISNPAKLQSIELLSEARAKRISRLRVQVQLAAIDEGWVEAFTSSVSDHPGNIGLTLEVYDQNKKLDMPSRSSRVELDDSFVEKLEALCIPGRAQYRLDLKR